MFDRLTNYLMESYGCHTIILYGSYVSGDYTEESDIDIVCFSDREEPVNDVSVFEGIQLDVWIYPTSQMGETESFLRVNGGRVLRDERVLADTFLENVRVLFVRGTRKLSTDEKDFLKTWLRKMYVRSAKRDIEGNYRFAWLMRDVLEIYFEMTGRWYLGPKKSFVWLKENDQVAYDLFDRVYRRDVSDDDVENLLDYMDAL